MSCEWPGCLVSMLDAELEDAAFRILAQHRLLLTCAKEYHKAVRDRIPEIIEREGKVFELRPSL